MSSNAGIRAGDRAFVKVGRNLVEVRVNGKADGGWNVTSRTGKAKLPTHIELPGQSSGLPRDSIILLEQIRTLDKKRLREKMGRVEDDIMQQVDAAIAVSFGLPHERLV